MTSPDTFPSTYPGAAIYPTDPEHPSVLVDPEALIRAWLADYFPDAVVQTETDEHLGDQDWTIKVGAGGGTSRFTLQLPRVTLDTFAPTRQLARERALLADHAMRWMLRGQQLGSPTVAVVSMVGVISAPIHVPDPNTHLRHFAGIYSAALNPLT